MTCQGAKEIRTLFSVGRYEGKGPLGTPRLRWENNIKMDRNKIVWEGGVDWILLALERDKFRAFVKKVGNFQVG
jgi:hypothetical protein